MRSLKALISKSTIHRAHAGIDWPNPYNLTKEDAKGSIEGWPLEIITLALKEEILQHPDRTIIKSLEVLQEYGVNGAMRWDETKDRFQFWDAIRYNHFNAFYNKYTPKLLRKRLEE